MDSNCAAETPEAQREEIGCPFSFSWMFGGLGYLLEAPKGKQLFSNAIRSDCL